MDKTYIKVRRAWTYFYRAVGQDGKTPAFMPSEHRNTAAARRFFNAQLAQTAHMIRKGQPNQNLTLQTVRGRRSIIMSAQGRYLRN